MAATSRNKKQRPKPGKGAKQQEGAKPGKGAKQLDVELRDVEARIAAMHSRIDRAATVLDDATARLGAVVAFLDGISASGASSEARELRQRLEQMLVAQRRTNELLDLALGVAIESEPGLPPGG